MKKSFRHFLSDFVFEEEQKRSATIVNEITIGGKKIPTFTNEFWTSKQRQAHSLHEVSYRACFKPQLPRFFIERLTKEGDVVYDPFSGRGTTMLEAALLGRNVIANDVNPLSAILSCPRLFIPTIDELEERLEKIPPQKKNKPDIDLSMFYHKKTLDEMAAIRTYLSKSKSDRIDAWIRMVATNRLTGHSKGFFSVYTLPPNQAASQSGQRKINTQRKQKPEYRNTRGIILKKSLQLMRDVDDEVRSSLKKIGKRSLFLTGDARRTKEIRSSSVQLTVTSPPFLDIVQYAQDNWLRCWFNGIDAEEIGRKITMSRTIDEWCAVMFNVFTELHRITVPGGFVAFEVGEVRKGNIALEEFVASLGMQAGFVCEGIMYNTQSFTKTANIWGVSNNSKGTNSNRIVLFKK
ncbi:MAG: DNA adenine methylase [Ignavibacteriales bacterium]|nr:DNA adenine methylase [Ignavibacteriales bacterium]